mmetsp:Transcript_30008/g.48486  ORF Transcript_30008/g.48486 Transcript_30008/m.48486 type:complete len:246 (+) Transcript_30008:475-1212(+)
MSPSHCRYPTKKTLLITGCRSIFSIPSTSPPTRLTWLSWRTATQRQTRVGAVASAFLCISATALTQTLLFSTRTTDGLVSPALRYWLWWTSPLHAFLRGPPLPPTHVRLPPLLPVHLPPRAQGLPPPPVRLRHRLQGRLVLPALRHPHTQGHPPPPVHRRHQLQGRSPLPALPPPPQGLPPSPVHVRHRLQGRSPLPALPPSRPPGLSPPPEHLHHPLLRRSLLPALGHPPLRALPWQQFRPHPQ